MDNLIDTGYAPVQGGELYYEISGAGPALVLIHAGVADCTMWDEQFTEFARQFRILRYDARGYGRSRSGDVDFSNRQDILDILNHLGIQKTAVLGLSRGGQIAIDFCVEHPERTLALVAVASGVSGYEPPPDESPRAQIEYAMFTRMDELDQQGDYEALNELEVRMWADGPGQPEGRAARSVRERVRRMNGATFIRLDGKPTHLPLDPPALQRLGEIRVPTLVVVGDLDTTSVLAISELLVNGIAGARKFIFPGVAHMVNMEKPVEFNRLVLDFLKSI